MFTAEWAEAARIAMDEGPPRVGKLDQYWEWIDRARAGYSATWALGVRDSGEYLLVTWEDGHCKAASITSDPSPADYVLVGSRETWESLAAGADPGRLVMYRGLRLERGEVLPFFRRIYFFVESLATLSSL